MSEASVQSQAVTHHESQFQRESNMERHNAILFADHAVDHPKLFPHAASLQ